LIPGDGREGRLTAGTELFKAESDDFRFGCQLGGLGRSTFGAGVLGGRKLLRVENSRGKEEVLAFDWDLNRW